MSTLTKKIATGLRVARAGGPRGLAALLLERALMWWRRDDRLWFGRLRGRPNDLIRLGGCRFDAGPGAQTGDLRELLLRDLHEKPEREALETFLNPELPAVEFGACIGVVSCLTNRRLRDPRRHVVVEANPEMLPLLEANRDRNGCRFTILHRAIGYGSGEVTFYVNDNVLLSSAQTPAGRAVTVPATTLRAILDEFGFERCTLICDIEGGEVELVERELETLRERVETIIMEVHEKWVGGKAVVGRMLRSLEGAGFEAIREEGYLYVFRNLGPARAGRVSG